MSHLTEYVRWRGDISFEERALTIIDNLVLCQLGYLDLKNGAPFGESRYCSFEAIRANALDSHTRPDTVHCVMIDCGKYPAEEIPDRKEGSGIDAIRLCFHKDAAPKAIRMGREILRKGYGLLLQPMVTTRYSDEEFRSLIIAAQTQLAEMAAFYIVDSFGVMNQEEIAARVHLADEILCPDMILGIHLHNNRGLAFANAIEAMHAVGENRSLLIDGSLSGIGKGAGNLCITYVTVHSLTARSSNKFAHSL